MKRKLLRVFALILVFAMLLSNVALAESGEDQYNKLETVAELIKQYGVNSSEDDDPIKNALIDLMNEDPALFDKIMMYMLSHYDRYSNYVPAELYDVYYPKAQQYVGIGIVLDTGRKGGNFVETVLEGSPAEEAGIKAGDQIMYVGSTDVRDYDVTQLSPLIRGEEDTSVTITVRRPYEESFIDFTMVREALYVSNVSYQDMGDGVMYIKIERFGDLQTFFDFAARYQHLPYEGYRSVVIDLRGNPGGDINVLLNMLNYVIPDKTIMFSVRYRDNEIQSFESNGIGWKPNKIVMLVNGESASAAEVFAGSLQDLGCADLVGETTYGKGYGQLHIRLGDKSTAVISNFEIQLPVTKGYDGVGIKPDYEVALMQEAYKLPNMIPLYNTGMIESSSAYSERAFALEQRLSLLGYLGKTPDGVFDSETLWAVNAFQRAKGLSETAGCPDSTIAAIESSVNALANTVVTVDTQLNKALELAYKAAEEPLSYTLPQVDFDD